MLIEMIGWALIFRFVWCCQNVAAEAWVGLSYFDAVGKVMMWGLIVFATVMACGVMYLGVSIDWSR